jgi:hypothetical protein
MKVDCQVHDEDGASEVTCAWITVTGAITIVRAAPGGAWCAILNVGRLRFW